MSVSLLLFGAILPWIIMGLFVALGSWIGFQLIHQNGRLLSRLEGLEQRLGQLSAVQAPAPSLPAVPAPSPPAPAGLHIGTPAPAFELPDLNGGRQSLAQFLGRKVLLIFFNPRCGFCTRMAPDLAALSPDGTDGRPVALVVTTGEVEENRKLVEEHGIRCPVLLQEGMEVASRYQCNGTPMGYLIDEQGNIASDVAVGSEALLALVKGPHAAAAASGNGAAPLGGKRSLEDSKMQRNGLPVGTTAPNFTVPLLGGGEISLEEYRGRKVLLVFSDPECGPCDQLAPQLEQLSRHNPGVQVLMVSRGEEEANRAKVTEHRLTFPVVLQRQWEVSRDYAMLATPVAYLIDENGAIAAAVAKGTEPILDLMGNGVETEGPDQRCRCGKAVGECGCGKQEAIAAKTGGPQ